MESSETFVKTLQLREDTHNALKLLAVLRETDLRTVADEALVQYLSAQPDLPKAKIPKR